MILLMKTKKALKKYANVWNGIKNKIKAIIDDRENDYGKDYLKIKFNSHDYLPLNKALTFHAMTKIIRSVSRKMVNFIHIAF